MAELAVGVGPLPSASAWRRALHHPSFAMGGVLVLLLLATAALSWVWTPHAAVASSSSTSTPPIAKLG